MDQKCILYVLQFPRKEKTLKITQNLSSSLAHFNFFDIIQYFIKNKMMAQHCGIF